MEFEPQKAIYQQIAEQMRDRILRGEFAPGERIPSVRELALTLGVNPNTINKSYQDLMDRGIIANQRGIGYFVVTDAVQKIQDELKQELIRDELPRAFRAMRELGMTLEDLATHFAEYCRDAQENPQ